MIIKKYFREIAFLAVLNFFPVEKLIFGHFWNCKKWNLANKIFREIDLFDFKSFFGLYFLNFSGPLCVDFSEQTFETKTHHLAPTAISTTGKYLPEMKVEVEYYYYYLEESGFTEFI